METNVKLIRVITGEEIVADVIEETADTVTVKNGLTVFPNGQQVGFAPWATVIDRSRPEITLKQEHVVYIAEVEETVAQKYNEVFGGSTLIKPQEKKIII